MSNSKNASDARRRRALYRAAHRGTKEMDWLLGRFAEAEIANMSDVELQAFEQFLALPDPEIQAWLMTPGATQPRGSAEGFVAKLKRFHDL